MDKPILYKGHEWRGRSGTGYVCDECGAICSKADEMTLTECKPRLAPVEWFGAHLQIRWSKTDDQEWPLEVVYKLFKKVRRYYENEGVVFSGDPLDDYEMLMEYVLADLETAEVA